MNLQAMIPMIFLAGLFLGPTRVFEEDIYPTGSGDLIITFIGHGSLKIEFNAKIIQIDPVARYADYSAECDADLILVTHDHGDHLDKAVIQTISGPETEVILTEECMAKASLPGATVLGNGETKNVNGIKIEAVPAYNLKHMRSEEVPFHSKGEGNGYVLTFGDTRVYVAGDTENTPEMKALQDIDIAFLPMNLPYTMTPEMVADAAKAFKPGVLYPYHFGGTDPARLIELVKDTTEIKVLVRKMN